MLIYYGSTIMIAEKAKEVKTWVKVGSNSGLSHLFWDELAC